MLSKNDSKEDFLNTISAIDMVCTMVFSRLENNLTLTPEIEEYISWLKEDNKILYHLIWAVVYELLGEDWHPKAIECYASALDNYLHDQKNKQSFDDLRRKYSFYTCSQSASYIDKLYEFAFSSINGSNPTPDEIQKNVKEISANIDYLAESLYYEKLIELITEVNAIPSDKITDISYYQKAKEILKEIYNLFGYENYEIDQFLLEKFSKASLRDETPGQKKQNDGGTRHSTIHNILVTENVAAFIKELSSSLLIDNSHKRDEINVNNNNISPPIDITNKIEIVKRRYLTARRTTMNMTMESDNLEIIKPAIIHSDDNHNDDISTKKTKNRRS